MTTLKAARADLAAGISTALGSITPVVTVYAYEPPTLSGTTVTVSTAGVGPDEWRLAVRVYSPAMQSQEGQDAADDIVEAIDTSSGLRKIPRSDWALDYDEVKGVFFVETVARYPREDF